MLEQAKTIIGLGRTIPMIVFPIPILVFPIIGIVSAICHEGGSPLLPSVQEKYNINISGQEKPGR